MPKVTPVGQAAPAKPAPAPAPVKGTESVSANAPPPVKQEGAPTTPPAPKPDADAAFAEITKREAALRDREAALKAKEAELTAPKPNPLDALKGKAKEDLTGALAEIGISYDDVVQSFLKNPPDPADEKFKSLEQRIEELVNERDKDKKSAAEQQQADYQRTITKIQNDAKDLAAKDERFALSNGVGDALWPEVSRRVENHFQEKGEVRSVESVLSELETELETQVLAMIKVPRLAEKVRAALSPQGGESASAPSGSPTLTHRATSTPAERPQRALTAKEIRQRMIDTITGSRAS